MKSISNPLARQLFGGLTASFFFILTGPLAAQSPSGKSPSNPVLIELFTSQGCSSCPPAEQLLNGWGMRLFKNHQALPLAFHVDYWDQGGWKDPFSIPSSSQRQREYTLFYHSSSLFTPEMTVNRQLGFNGADSSQAQYEWSQAALLRQCPPIRLKISKDSQFLHVQAEVPASIQGMGNPTLNIVVFENHLSTHIRGGENKGLFLKENFVVRYDRSILKSSLGSDASWNILIPLNASWDLSHTGVALWLQDLRTLKAQGVNWVYPLLRPQKSKKS